MVLYGAFQYEEEEEEIVEISLEPIGIARIVKCKHFTKTWAVKSNMEEIIRLKRELKYFNEFAPDSLVDKKRICDTINRDICSSYAAIIRLTEDSREI